MKIYEDWEFRLRFCLNNRVVYIPEPLSEYRLHAGGISRVSYSEHVKFIRLLFQKNAHLLSTVDRVKRKWIIQRFLAVESRFSSKQCLGRFLRLDPAALRRCVADRRQFRNAARRLAL
jgi:hypothetical protein